MAKSKFNMIKILWWDLKRAVHKQIPANLRELRQHCKDWAKISPQCCERGIKSYRKQILQLLLMNHGYT